MVNATTSPTDGRDKRQPKVSTNRRRSRTVALQVLYETNAVDHDAENVLVDRLADFDLPTAISEFARALVRGSLANCEEIDKIITTFAPNWPLNQMAIVDRNILRMAIFEIIFGESAPPKVAVNEAVELAKSFGSESSPKFVNGVLGSVMETVKQKSYS